MTRLFSVPRASTSFLYILTSALFLPCVMAAELLTPAPYTEAAIKLLGESIAYKTVEGEGQTQAYAQFLANTLIAGGFDAADVEVMTFDAAAFLVATYQGSSEAPPILLSAHMDVVSAHAEDWTRDPFTMVRENGYLYGRGATDNKFGIAMLVTTLIRLKGEGFIPARDIVLVFSGDEETQMRTTLVLADLFKNAELVLNSDAGGGLLSEDGVAVAYYVQAAEKTYADFAVTVTNPGGHSSTPRKDNAIYELAAAAQKIGAYSFPVQASTITLESFRQTGALTGGELGAAMLVFASDPTDVAAARVIATYPEYVGQLGTTCVATMLSAGHALNALPQRATMNINCRIFPGDSYLDVQKTLRDVIANPDVEISLVDEVYASDASPLREDVVAAVRKAINRRYPDLPVIPSMISGATDSLHFRAQGVDSYGVSGLFMKTSDEFAHGLNERSPEASVDGALDHWHVLLTELAD